MSGDLHPHPRRGGSFWPILWAVLLLAGLAGWLASGLRWDQWPRWAWQDGAWRALLVNFIYFTPLAAGMVVWPAVVMAARGQWAGSVSRVALAGVGFAPVSILALVGLWLGCSHWAPWASEPNLPNAAWLNAPFLFARDLAALAIFWALAIRFVRHAGRGKCRKLAAWLVFIYCLVFSLIAFDVVMALDPHWFSTLFGGYYFISGMYTAVAAWTLAALAWRDGTDYRRRHDLGKLIVAFSLLTTYMMFSQLIVIWYENLPHEARFVIPRMRVEKYGWVSAALLAAIYLGPLVLLLTRRAKRSPWFLGLVSIVVLAGMWVERWWLVTPTLRGGRPWQGAEMMQETLAQLSMAAAFLGATALAIWTLYRKLPAAPFAAAEGEAAAGPAKEAGAK